DKLSRSENADFILTADGAIRWRGEAVAKVAAGEEVLTPSVLLLADEYLTGPAREKVQQRLDLWINAQIETLLKPLVDLKSSEGLEGLARGVAFRIVEGLGILERQEASDEIRQLDQDMRASLRKHGVRFGAYNIYVPALLKPAPSQLLSQLWALKHGALDMNGLSDLPQLSASGRTSIPVDETIDKALYKVVGFRVCGPRAVRVDILERLADLIRPLVAWKPLDAEVSPPEGAIAQGGGFTVTVAMTSLLGCAGEDFTAILKSLGYRLETKEVERPVAPKAEEATKSEADAETSVDAVAAPSETVEAPAEALAGEAPDNSPVAEDVSTETVAPSESAGEATEAVEEASADAGEAVETETVTIEIWRPGRGDRRPRPRGQDNRRGGDNRKGGQARGDQGRGDQRGEKRHGGPRNGPKGGKGGGSKSFGGPARNDRAPKKDKPLDPNSPFAALMALKEGMDKKDKS
ncbi:MAG: helicase, partial [Roseibium sp.]